MRRGSRTSQQPADALRAALRTYRHADASAIANLIAVDEDEEIARNTMHLISRTCLNYDAFLKTLPERPTEPSLLVGIDHDHPVRAYDAVQTCADVTVNAFRDSMSAHGGRALVEAFFAYYGLVQLDGFRTLWWIGRCLDTCAKVSPLPSHVANVRDQARRVVASLLAEHSDPAAAQVEPYSCFQVVSDYVGLILKMPATAMDGFDRYQLNFDHALREIEMGLT
jgi:hypothetical protein